MLRELWPEPTRIEQVGRFAGRGPGAVPTASGVSTEYVVVPNVQRPTLLLPRRPRRAAAAALRNYKAPGSRLARLKLQTLSAATRLGFTSLLPDRIRVSGDGVVAGAGIDAHLRQALGREVLLCFYIGVPRAVQKPILQLLTPAGQTFGYAKIGINPLTCELVRGEAEALTALATAHLRHLVVPPVLYAGSWRGHEILVQGALSGDGPALAGSPALVAAMTEIARVRGVQSTPLTASTYWARCALGSSSCPTLRTPAARSGR